MPDDHDADLGDLYLKYEKAIEAAIRAVARKFRFRSEEVEDFAQEIRLHLVDPKARVLRRFKGGCTPEAFLSVVVSNKAHDIRNAQWGRWRPCVAARRLGPPGVRLDVLVTRDHMPLDQALTTVLREFPGTDAKQLEALAGRLRPRTGRHQVGELLLEHFADKSPDAERLLIDAEQEARVERILARMAEVLLTLSDRDRLLVHFVFEQEMTIADIARTWQENQKQLYRRLETILRRLRNILRAEGIDVKDEDLAE